MSTDTCPISHMAGDGCEKCNPALALEYAKGTIEDLERTLATTKAKHDEMWQRVQESDKAYADLLLLTQPKIIAERDAAIAALATKELEVTKLREAVSKYYTNSTASSVAVDDEMSEALSTPITTDTLDVLIAEKVKEARHRANEWADIACNVTSILECVETGAWTFEKAKAYALESINDVRNRVGPPPKETPPAQPVVDHIVDHDMLGNPIRQNQVNLWAESCTPAQPNVPAGEADRRDAQPQEGSK